MLLQQQVPVLLNTTNDGSNYSRIFTLIAYNILILLVALLQKEVMQVTICFAVESFVTPLPHWYRYCLALANQQLDKMKAPCGRGAGGEEGSSILKRP